MKLGDKVMRLPETFTDSGEDKRSLRRPVAGRVRPWAYGLGSLIFFGRPRKWSPTLQGERERKGGMGGW